MNICGSTIMTRFRVRSRANTGPYTGGNDEYACPACDEGDLRCPWGGACLQHNATCDGVAHCRDG